MVFDLGSIRAVLDLDDTSYERGILNAQALNNAFGQSFADAITNPVVFGLGKLREFAGAAVSLGQDILATAEEVQRLGEATGFSTDAIQAMRAEFELAGKGAEQADDILSEFNLRLGEAREGSGAAAEAIRVLGSDILGIRDIETAFNVVIQRLNQVEDGSQRAALVNQLFSGAGVKALDLLDETLVEITQRQRNLSQVTEEETIASLAGLNTTVGEFQSLVDGLATQGLASFIGGFADESDAANLSVEKLGAALQDQIVPGLRDAGEFMATITGQVSTINGIVEAARSEGIGGALSGRQAGGPIPGEANVAREIARQIVLLLTSGGIDVGGIDIEERINSRAAFFGDRKAIAEDFERKLNR